MKEVLDKLSSYNFFNYLLPGVIFTVITNYTTNYHFTHSNVIIEFILYYFIGLIISRIGSLVTEPILKKIKFLKFAPYEQFVKKSKIDTKIELLSEQNNMYRTLLTSLLLVLLLRLYEKLDVFFNLKEINMLILIIILIVIFLYSYKKQTAYISSRIKANEESKIKS